MESKKIQVGLNSSDEALRSLADLSPDAVAIQSAEQICYANFAAIALLAGQHPQGIIGKSIWDFVFSSSPDPEEDPFPRSTGA